MAEIQQPEAGEEVNKTTYVAYVKFKPDHWLRAKTPFPKKTQFWFQNPCQVTHNHLYLQLHGLWCPLVALKGTSKHVINTALPYTPLKYIFKNTY